MQTELNFNKLDNGNYGAEVTVNDNFAVHIERDLPGRVSIYKSVVSDGMKVFAYGATGGTDSEGNNSNFDQSFHDEVFPLYLLIESETPVTSGYVVENESE